MPNLHHMEGVTQVLEILSRKKKKKTERGQLKRDEAEGVEDEMRERY